MNLLLVSMPQASLLPAACDDSNVERAVADASDGGDADGGDIEARNILAGFSVSFSFYVPTKKSFAEAAKRAPL